MEFRFVAWQAGEAALSLEGSSFCHHTLFLYLSFSHLFSQERYPHFHKLILPIPRRKIHALPTPLTPRHQPCRARFASSSSEETANTVIAAATFIPSLAPLPLEEVEGSPTPIPSVVIAFTRFDSLCGMTHHTFALLLNPSAILSAFQKLYIDYLPGSFLFPKYDE